MPGYSDFATLYWVYRIGSGVKISDLNRNSKRARKVVEKLEKLGLARVEVYGRLKLVKLTPKGQRVYEKLLAALREVQREEVETLESPSLLTSSERSELPSWLLRNPWLKVIGERGRR